MSTFLNALALLLPLLGGYAIGTAEDFRGVGLAAVSLLLAVAAQRAARLYASPWDEFQGIEGDD